MGSLVSEVIENDDNFSFASNTSVSDFLKNLRGNKQLPLEVAIPLTLANVIIFVTGLVGNISVCVVITRHPALHTATNYYLFNLAVSDLTLLIFGLPNDVTLYWHQYPWIFGESFCKIRALMSEMATYVSVLTIVAFSTERYLAICYPLYLHTMSGFQRALWIIGCLWIVALISAIPFSIYSTVDYLTYPPDSDNILEESAFCAIMAQPTNLPLGEISFILFFLVPMGIIGVQYTRMALKISNQTRIIGKSLHGSVHRGSCRRHQSNASIIRMLFAVVIGFFLCWAPFHAQRLLFLYGRNLSFYYELNAWMFYITGIFYYFSCTLNPILYNLMSNRYRSAFKEILCGLKRNHVLLRSSTLRETRRPSKNRNRSDNFEQQCKALNTVIDEVTEECNFQIAHFGPINKMISNTTFCKPMPVEGDVV
ncbi:hypothetical protein PPYR_00664 [Photinus pyralis]|uniref:G-protein coupled receptors family 1 profile domain-containing protein n=1 Tax=Photinus pyralis TaxID=7054 RepID=A0A1Y1NI26_PHOPY|nr:neuropeptides capa receptor [Photinus pyralis]KAB0803694.1 hypothetical protein PPYR_00664 [Photinus pyralis]